MAEARHDESEWKILAGTVKEPRAFTTAQGQSVFSFKLEDESGQTWYVSAWNRVAKLAARSELVEGARIYVSGFHEPDDDFEDSDGNPQIAHHQFHAEAINLVLRRLDGPGLNM